jgi:predicted O-methyltransferase YrrM
MADGFGDDDDRTFLNTVVHAIPGWLVDYTALRTMDMLRFQEQSGSTGSILEIGVFAGRYFSVLLRSARKLNSTIIGLDTFQYVTLDQIKIHLSHGNLIDYVNLKLIKGLSNEWSANELLSELGGSARFVSIDGSHEKEDVYWDLRIAEEIISVRGIVAVDDYLNPMTLGVNEAVNHFFNQPRNLVPWAYIANKLFLARPSWAEEYKKYLEDLVMQDDSDIRSKTFHENLKISRPHVEVKVFNHKIIILP